MYREKIKLLRISTRLFRLSLTIKRKERRLNRTIKRHSLSDKRTINLATSLEATKRRFFEYEYLAIPLILRLSAPRRQ